MHFDDDSAIDQTRMLPESALESPLGYFRSEHERHEGICQHFLQSEVIEAMCDGDAPKSVSSLHHFLSYQLPMHIQDEQKSLFPLLERDEGANSRKIRDAIKYIKREQEFDEDLVDFVLSDLKTLVRGKRLVNPLRLELNLQTLLEGLADHAKWEARTILPLAEQLLTFNDLAELKATMIARRQI